MTGYDPRIEPPALTTWTTPWDVIPLLVWFLVEAPFLAAWLVSEKYRSLRAPRQDVAFALALAMQQTLSIAESDRVPSGRRETALVAARNLRSGAENLGLEHVDMVARTCARLDDLEERGLPMADGGRNPSGAVETDDETGLHAYCNDCPWHATPSDHEHATVWTDADVHTTFERHRVTVGLGEETKQVAQERARDDGQAASGGAA